jgi:hypothetical protein
VPGLGEPRKVRTVAIRPDGTPAPTTAAVTNGAGQGIVTGSAPSSRPATTGSATPAPVAQQAAPRAPQQPSATPAAAPKTQERAAAPATPPADTRTAALAPQQQTQAAAPPAAAAPRTDPAGGFAVQLGAPGSEAEARATFAALQRKYPDQLSGQSPIIRKTELAGARRSIACASAPMPARMRARCARPCRLPAASASSPRTERPQALQLTVSTPAAIVAAGVFVAAVQIVGG